MVAVHIYLSSYSNQATPTTIKTHMYPYRTQCHLIHAETTAIKKNLKKLFVEKQTYPIYALTTADCLVTASTVTQPYPVNNEAIYT